MEFHKHTQTDGSPKLEARDSLENCPQPNIPQVSGTAGGTYTAAEQAIINDHTQKVNAILSALEAIGLTIKS